MNRSTTSVVRSRAGSPSGQGWVSLLGGLVFQSHPRLLNGACLKREWRKERLLIPSQPYKQTNHCSQSLWAWFCLVLNGSSPLGSFFLILRDCEQRRNQKEGRDRRLLSSGRLNFSCLFTCWRMNSSWRAFQPLELILAVPWIPV